jgi:hypothetical protein
MASCIIKRDHVAAAERHFATDDASHKFFALDSILNLLHSEITS